MRKNTSILLSVVLMLSLLSGCGDPASTRSGDSASAGKGDITWSWGNFRGLYGDAEVTFNEDGGRDTVLLKYSNGVLYRQIQYNYEMYAGDMDETTGGVVLSGKAVYPAEKITLDTVGNQLYNYQYIWSPCDEKPNHWGAGVASDITPILEAGEGYAAGETPEVPEERYYSSYELGYDYEKEDSSGRISYQEMSHLLLEGTYQATYTYGGGYWLTKRVDGNPSKTWFYAADGRLDEDLTITWNYEKNKPVSLQLGKYNTDTYLAEISDDGRTVTYILDASHTNQDNDGNKKDLTQVNTLTFSRQDDGKPAMYKYSYYKEFLNTDVPEDKEYSITYQYDNGVLSGAVYQTPEQVYTITCNDMGMLETVDYLKSTLGAGDIGAKAYTYFDSGALESVTYYHDFTAGDPERVDHIERFYENGGLCRYERYDQGTLNLEVSYHENGVRAGSTTYYDGKIGTTYTTNENGVYTSYTEYYNGILYKSGKMTGENEFTLYYDYQGTMYIDRIYTYGEDGYEMTRYNSDGSVYSTSTYEYDGTQHY